MCVPSSQDSISRTSGRRVKFVSDIDVFRMSSGKVPPCLLHCAQFSPPSSGATIRTQGEIAGQCCIPFDAVVVCPVAQVTPAG